MFAVSMLKHCLQIYIYFNKIELNQISGKFKRSCLPNSVENHDETTLIFKTAHQSQTFCTNYLICHALKYMHKNVFIYILAFIFCNSIFKLCKLQLLTVNI